MIVFHAKWTKSPYEIKKAIEHTEDELDECCGWDAFCDTCKLRVQLFDTLRTLLEHLEVGTVASMTRPKERIPDLADCHCTISVLQVVYDVGQRAWHNDQPLPGGLFLLAASKRIEEMAKEDVECE